MPFKAKNNREAVVVCAIHVVKRPSKRSVLVYTIKTRLMCIYIYTSTLRLLGRFTTCFAQTTTASRLLFALNGTSCLENEKKIGNFRF